MVLRLALIDGGIGAHFGLSEDAAHIKAARFPMRNRALLIEEIGSADHIVKALDADLRHQSARFFGDKEEIIDDMFGQTAESFAQDRVLRRDTDWAGIEMAFAHHNAASGDERRGREAKFIGTEQCGDDDIASGAQAAIDLHRDSAAQSVEDERLLRFG